MIFSLHSVVDYCLFYVVVYCCIVVACCYCSIIVSVYIFDLMVRTGKKIVFYRLGSAAMNDVKQCQTMVLVVGLWW